MLSWLGQLTQIRPTSNVGSVDQVLKLNQDFARGFLLMVTVSGPKRVHHVTLEMHALATCTSAHVRGRHPTVMWRTLKSQSPWEKPLRRSGLTKILVRYDQLSSKHLTPHAYSTQIDQTQPIYLPNPIACNFYSYSGIKEMKSILIHFHYRCEKIEKPKGANKIHTEPKIN